ncbi:hypothetical protein B194_5427 [Serratia plymuthica A30]|uniref:Uncharacterized protein n=1 Tax=Serratia plymuthica TaxID=82996 RepID=A0A318NWA6_SERPL|nr:hypothetical protein [Serratia plymuthica]AGO57691.1 protein TraE [Serratia plymuthica 4Rx13]EKF67025.1 hypothetical protein B194_5427 [Serratia plymuthica A30]PYD36575.1 hypothetical protein CT690_23815 [Serratia plymuthica]
MNTQNVNVKTATKNRSERYGQKPISNNVQQLIYLANYEGTFMTIAAELRLGLSNTPEELYINQLPYEGICEDVRDMLDKGLLFTVAHWELLKSLTDIAATLPWRGWQEQVLSMLLPDWYMESPVLTCDYETEDDPEHLDALYGYESI